MMKVWDSVCSALRGGSSLISQNHDPSIWCQHKSISAGDIPSIRFGAAWDVLGPFQIGTREAAWGADPLEYFGGFRYLRRDTSHHDRFGSSLGTNGTVTWSETTIQFCPSTSDQACARISVDYPDVDWKFLRSIYGWAATQWQGWARGQLHLNFKGNQTLLLYTEGIIEIWINGQHYFGGDFYRYDRAPIVLHLKEGEDQLQIDVRLVRDIRSMGGSDTPNIDVTLRTEYGSDDLVVQPFHAHQPLLHEVLISDVLINDSSLLGSPFASIVVRNDGREDVLVLQIKVDDIDCETSWVSSSNTEKLKVLSGQSRPLAFQIKCAPGVDLLSPINIRVLYRTVDDDQIKVLTCQAHPRRRQLHDFQRLAFMHPAGVVSYAMMRPPLKSCVGHESLPILLVLHGAGVEVDDEALQDSVRGLAQVCAWTVLPTGGTTWSADDWHQWGFADVEAAIRSLDIWAESVHWPGPKPEVNRWLIVGHSNGGQGTWYVLTHHPDRVIAAAPLSGYSSIQNYVPYVFWQPCDPLKMAVVQAALTSYQHELLLENSKGIPIYIQHGEQDDNVPAYHSRLSSQRLGQANVRHLYKEYPGLVHWWDDVLNTEPLKSFVKEHIDRKANMTLPASDFTLISSGHGDMGTKNGVAIVDLMVPGQLAKICVSVDSITLTCTFYTSNVQVFSLPLHYRQCLAIIIDGQRYSLEADEGPVIVATRSKESWIVGASIRPVAHRQGTQLGPLDSFLRTTGPFQIVMCSPEASRSALQIARNLFQYFAADAEITSDHQTARMKSEANLITVAIGKDVPSHDPHYPLGLQFVDGQLELTDLEHRIVRYPSTQGLGAVFLRPIPNSRLELLVWGIDMESLEIAARLVPMLTGTGQPDFIVFDKSMLWRGLDGTLAVGSFDRFWRVGRNSYVS